MSATSAEGLHHSGISVESSPVTRPWRRDLRFSIRGLIVVVVVIGIGLGWLVRSAQIQHAAVAAITNAGGSVTDDHLAHLGALDKLNVLVLDNTQVSDAGLVHLKRLTTLSYLSLSNTQVTDRGLKNLHEQLHPSAVRAFVREPLHPHQRGAGMTSRLCHLCVTSQLDHQ